MGRNLSFKKIIKSFCIFFFFKSKIKLNLTECNDTKINVKEWGKRWLKQNRAIKKIGIKFDIFFSIRNQANLSRM
jgi:hypothetical protein